MRSGSPVMVVDGLGRACRGELIIGRNRSEVRVINELRNYGEPAVHVTLAAGLSAGHKFDTTVEKATELGVRRIVPLITEKGKVSLEEPKRARTKLRRWERVALAAVKQCRRSCRPEIASPRTIATFLAEADPDDCKLVFATTGQRSTLADVLGKDNVRRVTLLIGPEAGLTDEETAAAVARGFVPVTLGPRVLRTETAGPVACALVMQQLGELS
ncbi:MAG: 16S rRNA (uracil(1498)-N(3))-methyltransferase [Candidatus Zixiibacteriota bacterium]|nr:MAG: 16S rRNA (uracil(1498)-N(3))-methyltransferase [candidate division Zixibacteria bacterium]